MRIDLKIFQKELAQQKVYDTWQYVNSLRESLTYMSLSYELLNNVYRNRGESLKRQEQSLLQTALKKGSMSVTDKDLKCTDINIAGASIDDTVFLRKTIMEFFHYARISIDILFQIINAALLGDEGCEITDRNLVHKINTKLKKVSYFSNLKSMLDDNKKSDTFKYIRAFDNYIKHIKTILVTIKTSFLIGNTNEFMIREFIYDGKLYQAENAINKVREVENYVQETVEKILLEVQKQLPNCLNNRQRIHNIRFKQTLKVNQNSNVVEYISFFIEVQDNISELPNEIKVLPLIIKPNDEIYSYDFRFKKIFIKKKDCDENGIIGCAELKNGLETNEFYRIFKVRSCGIEEYQRYICSFANDYPKISINPYAMEGEVIII